MKNNFTIEIARYGLKTFGFWLDLVNQNKILPFKIKRQAKIVFPSDGERTVYSNVKVQNACLARIEASWKTENSRFGKFECVHAEEWKKIATPWPSKQIWAEIIFHTWAAPCENVSLGICGQRRPKSACTFTLSVNRIIWHYSQWRANVRMRLHVRGMNLNLCIFAHVGRHLYAWCVPYVWA